MKKISETTVILNFLEDSCTDFVCDEHLQVEVPAGSWSGSKSRSIADIHGPQIPGIEAKGTFSEAMRDFCKVDKNNGILHYIYASTGDAIFNENDYWRKAGVSACVYLTEQEKWCMIGKRDGLFDKIIRKELQFEIPGK